MDWNAMGVPTSVHQTFGSDAGVFSSTSEYSPSEYSGIAISDGESSRGRGPHRQRSRSFRQPSPYHRSSSRSASVVSYASTNPQNLWSTSIENSMSMTVSLDEAVPGDDEPGLELQAGFRPKVDFQAIEKASGSRRTKPALFKCSLAGCFATFTAKHNLQSIYPAFSDIFSRLTDIFADHINSHKGIRAYHCPQCRRGFATSHVLTRHKKKCTVNKRHDSIEHDQWLLIQGILTAGGTRS
ncbi:hypothetical protein C8J56DRAFT_483188 [Mycena floridula]|nr:hypothetical protein C8J56DRAFT_483188 [Mycena floridula]